MSAYIRQGGLTGTGTGSCPNTNEVGLEDINQFDHNLFKTKHNKS